jgi:MFS family permease
VGEATLSPAAYSIVADLFPLERLARALSVYSMGIHLGGGLASVLGGFVIDWAGEATSIRLPLVRPLRIAGGVRGGGAAIRCALLLDVPGAKRRERDP